MYFNSKNEGCVTMQKIIKHLDDNNMTYFQHMLFAFWLARIMLVLSFKSLAHAILPCLFITDVSDAVSDLKILFQEMHDNSV